MAAEHLGWSICSVPLLDIRVGNPILTHPGKRVLLLRGPTGVGKTTTVAKLAAGFRIEAKRRVVC